MLVILGYDLDDVIVDEIVELDLHTSDILDLINERAVQEDNLHHVWHLDESASKKFHETMDQLYDEFSASKKEILNDDGVTI